MSPRGRRWTAAAAVLLPLLALAAAETAGWPFLRQPLQDLLARKTGVPVLLDAPFALHLLGHPRLHVEHLRVGSSLDGVPTLADAQRVDLEWRWGDLWRWRQGEPLRVQLLQAAQLEAHLVRNAQGQASWQLGAPAAASRPTDPAQPLLPGLPHFGSLRVADGRIDVDDQPLATQLHVEIRGGEGDAGDRSGYQAKVSGRYRNLPLQLSIHSGSLLPVVDESGQGPPAMLALRVEGTAGAAQLMLDGRAGALLGDNLLRGRLHFSGPSLAQVGAPLGLTLPQTPPFSLSGEIAHEAGVWTLRADEARIGHSLLNGDFRFDDRSSPPLLSGRLGGRRLVLADLGPAIGGAPAGAAPKARGKVLPDRPIDLPSLKAMNADVQVEIAELDFGSEAMAPLDRLRTRVVLQGGVLELRALQATVAGGEFSGSTRLDANVVPAQWGLNLHLAKVDVAGWLRGVMSPQGKQQAPPASNGAALKRRRDSALQGGGQPVHAYLTGMLEGDIRTTGRGRSTAEILSTLDGQALLTLRDGSLSHLVTELAGLDVAQALGVMIKHDDPLPLRCAKVDLLAHQGVLQPRLAVLDNRDSTVRVDGQVDLRNETLALRAVTRPKDFSPLTLRTPILVTGTLAAPHVGVQASGLAGKVLGALALGAVAGPAAALLPLVDPGSPEANPCAAAR